MKKIPTEKRRENHNRYQREYKKKNRDKVAKWQLNYYQKKATQYAMSAE